MKLLFAFYLLTGAISPMDGEYKGYYSIYCPDDRIIEFATEIEVLNYIQTGKFEYFIDKGYNYKKHYRKQKRKKLWTKWFNSNNCNGISYKH